MFTNPSAAATGRAQRRRRLRRFVAGAISIPLAVVGLVTASAPAAQAAAVAPVAQQLQSGFPAWYEDNNGNRIQACLDANDPNCILPAAGSEPDYNPAQPLNFPTNFPSEFFYAYAQSDDVATPGCGTSAPGRAFVTMAVEGAFTGGAPAVGEQMTFGRIRFRATSGLCAGQQYTFTYPFGTATFTANSLGAVPVSTATTDVGCVPTPTTPCNFTLATGSAVFGTNADGGFLRWDAGAPAGYLGDGVTPHAITGGTNGNVFTISGPGGAGPFTGSTNLFTVAGKRAGAASASPNPVDFGGVLQNQNSTVKTVTVTNLDKASITFSGGNAIRVRTGNGFTIGNNGCNTTLVRDASCTFDVTARPGALGAINDFIDLTYTGGVNSPVSVPLTVTGLQNGQAAAITATGAPLAFGDVRLRTALNKTLTLTNSGTAPLSVSGATLSDLELGVHSSQYKIAANTCAGVNVAVGASCQITVQMAPFSLGQHPATLTVTSNTATSPNTFALTGNAIGGVAAVANTLEALDNFPTWYRDENGVKVSQCLDASDPNCIVLADATYAGGPVTWLPSGPLNFPGEFFYYVSDSDIIATPGCQGTAPGRSMYRSAIEGTFANGDPVDTEQMVFGRERLFVTSGLCPNALYTFTSPYGQTTIRTNASGGVARNAGTVDLGCVPVPGTPCDFAEALTSPVLGGMLRWDPAVAPAAPAGYLGDAATLHRVVGAPYTEPGAAAPANYYKITGPGLPAAGLQTNQFTVMGKMQGPLEATPASLTGGKLVAPNSPVGTPVTATATLTNTGVAVGASTGALTLNTFTVGGLDGADFAVSGGTCIAGLTLNPGDTCTVTVTFTPGDTGVRAATLTVGHTGLNNPFVLGLQGTGEAGGGAAAISFSPRSLAFGQLKVLRTSKAETVTVSNAGGSADLLITGFTPPADYSIGDNSCTAPVAPNASCTVSFVFTPGSPGAKNGNITVADNVGAGSHSIGVTGAGFNGGTAVSGSVGRFGYPNYYQDANGTRLEPCLDNQNCVLLGVPTPDAALSIPDNFPSEFFYALADSEQVAIPDTGCGTGTAFLRVGIEGSFANANADPVPGDQTTFTRIRLVVRGGLCPNVATYTATTPYGVFTFGTDATGAVKPNAGTQDVGCGAAPCTFSDALVTPGPVLANVDTPIESFLRWDPNIGTAAPAGYLGDAASFRKITGGTYVKPGGVGAFNGFEIRDSATNLIASTDNWLVAGKIAGPLNTNAFSLDFGTVDTGQTSPTQTVTVTNVGSASTTVTPTITGTNANQFTRTGGTCGAAVAPDATCTVIVAFAPSVGGTGGVKNANLVLTPTTGPTATVALTGTANAVATPSISVTPGVLSYGTRNAGTTTQLTFTVSNPGQAPLDVSNVALNQSSTDFSRSGGTCAGNAFSVAAGGSCTLSVSFSPKAIGARTGNVTLTHNAPGTSTVVSLTGAGAGATFTASPSPVGFGNVKINTNKTSTISIRNAGTVNGTITATATSGAPFTITANGCLNVSVAPGRTCSITVQFRPTVVQNYAGTLTLTGNAAVLPTTTTVNLTGAGR